jgi:hypothetical protein
VQGQDAEPPQDAPHALEPQGIDVQTSQEQTRQPEQLLNPLTCHFWKQHW